MKLPRIFENKFIIISIQFLILSLFLLIFKYHFDIAFDSPTSEVHRHIIQILANYILYSSWSELIFIYLVWILISLIPIFIYRNLRKAYSTNLLTFFFPNFFFYVFLSRYSPDYFDLEFPNLIIKSIVLCIIIISISIGLSFLLNRLSKKDLTITKEDLEVIQKETTMICPTCGTKFKSIPKYCYKCNTKLIKDNKE
ncbi:MAG: hypothetical protein ACFFC1_08510 [Promethearchaeota archaeon]